jgi:hypothetical protein
MLDSQPIKEKEFLTSFLEKITNSKNHKYFFEKTFDEAFDESRRSSKILISILYSPSIEESVNFCKYFFLKFNKKGNC